MLKVRKTQLQDWAKLLMKEGIIEERTIRKTKELAIRKPDEELKLSQVIPRPQAHPRRSAG